MCRKAINQSHERIVCSAVPVLSISLSVRPSSVRPSVSWMDYDHSVRPIDTILVSLESPDILVSEKFSFVDIGHP